MRDSNRFNKLASQGIKRNFMLPSAPLWRIVRGKLQNVKYHLNRVIDVHTLPFEEMSTLLCKIEVCLKRPIALTSDNCDNYSALTPSHFLIDSALTSVPEFSLFDEK